MAVEVEHIWKTFQIPHEKRSTFFENLMGLMRPNNYETFSVLKDISFQVEAGECVGIIGDNGSGKSTLLKIIANILRASKGTVRIKGKMTPFLELGVGFHPDMTARENIGVYGTIMGLSRREIDERIDDVIDFADLHRFEDTKLKNLSSGMQVRLAFSTAIQTNPDVLLVDEVLAVGDMEFQQKCFDVFNRYRKEGVTILFVSHDLGAVRRFCDRTLLLGGGEQRAFGETGEVLDKYVYCRSESKDLSDDSTMAPSSPKRWGNQKVTITDVEFLDKFGIKGLRFNSRDPMIVRIHYYAQEDVSDITFGIAIHTEDGRHIFGTNTKIKKTPLRVSVGGGHIDLRIDHIPMLSGKYLLSPAAQSLDYITTYDWIDKQFSFEVIPTSDDAGMIAISCNWAK
ncbi:MAG: ABC transporter ATP-binding protein [Methanothrix sp.]|nr:ABC transporter ATP-binding protein [Methanothrix sp.]MDD4447371.1 ABC transporter ATP-binding protein [Methanothrix sp.]